MDNCDWCNLSEEDKQFQVYESKSWSVDVYKRQVWFPFCYSDEASGHQACMNEHLPTANQMRDMHSVSRIC